jgi:hypothetical protein
MRKPNSTCNDHHVENPKPSDLFFGFDDEVYVLSFSPYHYQTFAVCDCVSNLQSMMDDYTDK